MLFVRGVFVLPLLLRLLLTKLQNGDTDTEMCSRFLYKLLLGGKGGVLLRGVRKLNNNAVVCLDSKGRDVIAMGKGIGFGDFPREIPLAEIERSFYNVNPEEQKFVQDLPSEIMVFTAKVMDIVKNELPYELSSNAVFLMADHIAFAIERSKKNIHIRMPLAYDVQQMYPTEYKAGQYIVERIRKEFKVFLSKEEVVGIAMNLVNGVAASGEQNTKMEVTQFEEFLEEITEIVEGDMHIMLNRESFNFARYATHLQYLFHRMIANKAIKSDNLSLYGSMRDEFPGIAACAEHISIYIAQRWKTELSKEEKLYLILHINRICEKEGL